MENAVPDPIRRFGVREFPLVGRVVSVVASTNQQGDHENHPDEERLFLEFLFHSSRL